MERFLISVNPYEEESSENENLHVGEFNVEERQVLPDIEHQRELNLTCAGDYVHPRSYCNNDSFKVIKQKVLSYSLFGEGTRWNSILGPNYRNTIPILAAQMKKIEFYKDWTI